MSVMYVADQGAYLTKTGNRLVVKKARETLQWVHAFKIEQLVLMGNITLSPHAVAFLLQQGIDTVFMSLHGKYRGRLISRFGKNIELRRRQFRCLDDPVIVLALAKSYVRGKLENCRTLLRKYNKRLKNKAVISTVHRITSTIKKIGEAESVESLRGLEGQCAASYFGCFGNLLSVNDISFDGRNRRPPKDPVNVLLSLGYTLLANAVQTQINVTGLDPYLGCLHSAEYGRPSLVLDIMEEFRPVVIDSLVLTLINKKIISVNDFYKPDEHEPAAFDFAEEFSSPNDYPILLKHQGMKKFIAYYEKKLNRKLLYNPKGQRLTIRQICLEQARKFVGHLQGEESYEPFIMR